MLNYKRVSIFNALVSLILFLILMVDPRIIFNIFEIQEHDSAFFILRRAAMLFLGFSIIAFLGRNSSNSKLRQAICLGISISMFALAILGIIEYFQGSVGLGVFIAIVTEIIIGVLYFRIWLLNLLIDVDN